MKLLRHWGVEPVLGSSLLAAGLALVALYGWIDGNFALQDKIIVFFTNVVLVLALQIFSGNSGILSFGHMAFAGVGGYATALLMLAPTDKEALTGLPGFLQSFDLPFLLATLLAALVTGAIALGAGLPVLRLDGASAVIAVFSLLLIANVVFSGWTGVTRGAGGLYAIPAAATLGWALAWAVVAVFVARWFKDSSTGLQLQASREDPFSAASIGVPVRALRLRAWVLSATVSAVGGALIATRITTISPTDFFLQATFTIIVMFIIGGMATVSGAVLGTALVTLVTEVLRPHEDDSLDLGLVEFGRLTGLTQLALVVMILAVMYFRREGLVGRRELDESLRMLLSRR